MIAAGSDAERYIAAFALIALATHMLVLLVTNIKLPSVEIKYIQKNEVVFRLFILFISVLTLFNVYFFYTASDLTATLNISLRHLLPPLQAFMIFFLIRRTFIGGKKLTLLTVFSFCIFFVGMFAVHEGKIPIFIGIAALFYWLRLTKITLRKTSLCLLVTLIIGLAGLQLTSVMRSPEGSIKTFFTGSPTTELAHGNIPRVLRAPLLKILYRQSATVYCFKKVLDYGSDAPFALSDQFFWIQGLVPRILWSEKPKLSRGQVYTTKILWAANLFPSRLLNNAIRATVYNRWEYRPFFKYWPSYFWVSWDYIVNPPTTWIINAFSCGTLTMVNRYGSKFWSLCC
ncbi:MAG: hypothetical protein ACJZ9G_10210 [Rhodospirillales bacterium]